MVLNAIIFYRLIETLYVCIFKVLKGFDKPFSYIRNTSKGFGK